MDKKIKDNKGITLMALIITIIVLMIITGIGIGASTGMKGNISESKETVATAELSKIQQAVLENYVKYKQMNQERFLKGEAISYDYALKEASYDTTTAGDPSLFYYKLDKMHLKEMGLQNINNDDQYIVNYSSGEVFNITQKKTSSGNVLYVYAK